MHDRITAEDERDLDRGFYLSAEAQVGELRRLYALEPEEGGSDQVPLLPLT